MKHFIPALRMLIFMTVLTGVVYPLAITGVAKVIFAKEAVGSLIKRDGKIVGSDLIGQKFENPRYFWSRPSATDYNPLPSGGTNLGQASEALKKQVEERTAKQQEANGTNNRVPQDLLFASGSGLDPHISPKAAYFQVARVARARSLDIETMRALIKTHTEAPQMGFLGEAKVNVLRLNIELDKPGI